MRCRRSLLSFFKNPLLVALLFVCPTSAQAPPRSAPGKQPADNGGNHFEKRAAWFARGRVMPGKSAAELRLRAYRAKMQMRAERRTQTRDGRVLSPSTSPVIWMPLGPAPLASDSTGLELQDYHQVTGRATAVAIDPADPTNNTMFIGGAQGGVWKSTNAANASANSVTWTPLTDDAATLSTGAIAIQPGNSDPLQSVILVATGETNNSGDSYFDLGILRSS